MTKISAFFFDAGPSNNFLSLLKNYQTLYEWELYLFKDSPAWKVFTTTPLGVKITVLSLSTDIEILLQKSNPHIVLLGTSWQNKVHLEFIKVAKKQNIVSIAMLEHWVNYKERFNYPDSLWKDNIPTMITVNDNFAYQVAQEVGFTNILKLKFYNLLDDINTFESKSIKNTNSLLFISEPTKDVASAHYNEPDYWGFNEYTTCEALCENIQTFKTNKLTIRLHPSDTTNKYNYIVSRYTHLDITIQNPYDVPLIDSIVKHSTIIGIDGYVLFEAMVLGKLSISFIPSLKRKCVVPIFKQNIITSLENVNLEQFERKLQTEDIKSFGIDFASLITNLLTKN